MSRFDEELAGLKSDNESEWVKAKAASLLATRGYHRQLAIVFLEKALLAVLVAIGVLYANSRVETLRDRHNKERDHIERAFRTIMTHWEAQQFFCATGEDADKSRMFTTLADAEVEVALTRSAVHHSIGRTLGAMLGQARSYVAACNEGKAEERESRRRFCIQKTVLAKLITIHTEEEALPEPEDWDWRTVLSEEDAASRCGDE